jgi:hypothetical protein
MRPARYEKVGRSGNTPLLILMSMIILTSVELATPHISTLERKLVDSDPPYCRMDNSDITETEAVTGIETDTPILRLQGGVGEEEKEGQTAEETGERFILTTLNEEESEAIG